MVETCKVDDAKKYRENFVYICEFDTFFVVPEKVKKKPNKYFEIVIDTYSITFQNGL